jgi:predicted Zn-dependent protease
MHRVVIALALAVAAGCGGNVINIQRKILHDEMPAVIEMTDAGKRWKGEPRIAKVRIYADEEYRAQNMRWKHGFTDQIDYANQLLEPAFGVRLEPEFKDWDRRAGEASLAETLKALVDLDAGDDVAWVIGLTSSLTIVSDSVDALGMAYPMTPHIVMRGFADVKERAQFKRALPDLERAELEQVHEARRRHKQVVVLLHEIGHTLGGIHENDPAWILHREYTKDASFLSDRNRELMLIAAEDRIRPAKERAPVATAEKMLAALEQEWGGWVQGEKDTLIAQLRNVIDSGKAGETAADVPSAAYAQFDKARTLARRGKLDEAITELEPLIAAYPANATIRLVACEIELARPGGPKADAAQKTCGRAIELAAGDPRPHISIAVAHLRGKDVAAARAELVTAEVKIANLPRPEEAWVQLAGLYQQIGALSWAEAAIGKSGQADHPIAAWVKSTRARYGVPPGKVAPEEEAEAVAAVRQILDAVYAQRFADAERAARAAEKKWPKLAGVSAARCDLALRQEQLGAAKQRCKAALAAYPDASWAQYLTGIIILRGTRAADTKAGIAALERAIALDPELAQAWRALAKALVRAKDAEGLARVRADYQTRFGRALGE